MSSLCHSMQKRIFISSCKNKDNINPTIFNIIRWVTGSLGQITQRPRVWCKYYFFFIISCKILCKKPFNSFYYFYYKITKITLKSFECSKLIKSLKRGILGTSDAWNPSIYNILSSDAGWFVQMNPWPSVWCSKRYFFFHLYKLTNVRA